MSMFWSKKWGRNKNCGITQSRLRPGKNKYGLSYTLKLPCDHYFYRSAIFKWMFTVFPMNPTCPLCRKQFDVRIIFE